MAEEEERERDGAVARGMGREFGLDRAMCSASSSSVVL
jgi:hypothetical protein